MIPTWYIIIYILLFTKRYFNENIIKAVNIGICLILAVIVGSLYIYKFETIYIINWIFKSIVPIILMAYLPVDNKSLLAADNNDKRKFLIGLIIGLCIMFIPGSRFYTSICRNIKPSEYLISEMLIYFCGVITIFLNKYFANKIFKIGRKRI